MEHDETSKLADVQTKPADLLVSDLADEPAAVVKTTEPAAEPAEPRTTAAKTKNPKRVEQGKKLAEWNKANKRRQLLEPALKQVEATSSTPALKQLATSSTPKSSFETKGETKGNTKDYFLIGETILIIGLLSVGLFCYTTSSASTDKATTSGSKKAHSESTQLEAQSSKKAQLVETQSKEDNIFDM